MYKIGITCKREYCCLWFIMHVMSTDLCNFLCQNCQLCKIEALIAIFHTIGGTQHSETEWLVETIKSNLVFVEGQPKPLIRYHLPIIGNCCRSAWVLGAGFPNPRNGRVGSIEAVLRRHRGKFVRKLKRTTGRFDTRTNYAIAFLEEHILTHCHYSPCRTIV